MAFSAASYSVIVATPDSSIEVVPSPDAEIPAGKVPTFRTSPLSGLLMDTVAPCIEVATGSESVMTRSLSTISMLPSPLLYLLPTLKSRSVAPLLSSASRSSIGILMVSGEVKVTESKCRPVALEKAEPESPSTTMDSTINSEAFCTWKVAAQCSS